MKKYSGIKVPKRVYKGRPIKYHFKSMKVGQCVYYNFKLKVEAEKERKIINASAWERGFEITTRVQKRRNGEWRVGVWMVKKTK